MSDVHGSVAAGFEPVAAQFEENLRTLEVGAAFAVFRHGEPVVDLWGGLADANTGASRQVPYPDAVPTVLHTFPLIVTATPP